MKASHTKVKGFIYREILGGEKKMKTNCNKKRGNILNNQRDTESLKHRLEHRPQFSCVFLSYIS